MNRLSRYFSVILGVSMACLLMGLMFSSTLLCGLGLAALVSIPIFRAIYAALWFYYNKNLQGFWFSVLVLIALGASMYWGAGH